MTVLLISAIVGVAAITAFVACLRGFGRALRHKKVAGVLVTVGDSKGGSQTGRNSLIDFPKRNSVPTREPVPGRVCGSTMALVEMAVLLGSRSAYDVPSGSSDAKAAKLRRRARARKTGAQPLSNS